MNEIDQLLEVLRTHPGGPIDRITAFGKNVLAGLVEVWPVLSGSSDQSTTADKLYRAEHLTWAPPLLTFRLERHGGTVNGSTRADLHFWEVDLENRIARIARKSYRQLERADGRLDCVALAQGIASAIDEGRPHEALDWEGGKQRVTIKLGVLISETFQSTTAARRKRFRKAFLPLMTELGWTVAPKGNLLRFSRPIG